MVESITTIGTAAVVAYLSKDGVAKLLGPTADYLGSELKHLVEKSQENVVKVFKKAERKLGDRLQIPGTVNPRVFRHVYDEARFCESELLAEYFAGVLASSRTESGDDDRGVYYAQLVKSLSIHQIQFHYFFYYIIWKLSRGRAFDLNDHTGRTKLTVVIPAECYAATFGVTPSRKAESIVTHSLSGLARTDLIASDFLFSGPDVLRANGVNARAQSFKVSPTITGIELFLWVHGRGEETLNSFLGPDLVAEPDLKVIGDESSVLRDG